MLPEQFQGTTVHLVQTLQDLAEVLGRLSKKEILAVDVEASGTNIPDEDYVVAGICLADSPWEGWYIPFGHRSKPSPLIPVTIEQLSQDTVLEALRPLLATKLLLGHGLRYDYRALRKVGITPSIWFDTHLASWILDERKLDHGLKQRTREELHREPAKLSDVAGQTKDFTYVPVEKSAVYAAGDACNTFGLFQRYLPELREQKGLSNVFWKIEMPCLRVFAEMEDTGIDLDKAYIEQLHGDLDPKIEEARQKMNSILEAIVDCPFDQGFNPKKDNHVIAAWYLLKLDLKGKKKDPPKLERDVLKDFLGRKLRKDQQAFIEALLEYRTLEKIRSTYTFNLLDKVSSTTGRLHPNFRQAGTSTGRISSQNPNSQNFPRGDETWDVRKAFRASEGNLLAIADYDRMEIKVTAAMSRCPVLKSIETGLALYNTRLEQLRYFEDSEEAKRLLKEGDEWATVDMHQYTASQAYKMPYLEVDKDTRFRAKAVNFGIIYGISEFGLSRNLGISLKEARALINGFMNSYPGVAKWIKHTHAFIMAMGFAETPYGRRRRMPKRYWEEAGKHPNLNDVERSGFLREGTNMVIQGGSADVVKIAMRRTRDALDKKGLPGRIQAQIHDEIVVEAPQESIREVADTLQECMVTDLNGVWLTAEASIRKTWSKRDE